MDPDEWTDLDDAYLHIFGEHPDVGDAPDSHPAIVKALSPITRHRGSGSLPSAP